MKSLVGVVVQPGKVAVQKSSRINKILSTLSQHELTTMLCPPYTFHKTSLTLGSLLE